MNIAVIYASTMGNTRRLAEGVTAALSNAHKAKIFSVNDKLASLAVAKADLVIFASGIYFWKHHRMLLELARNLSDVRGKRTIIMSTAGMSFLKKMNHKALRNILLDGGFDILGDFSCKGFDNYGPLKWFNGGINKGRPNQADVQKAVDFVISKI